MPEWLMWGVAVLSLIGTALVTARRRVGFLFWFWTNAVWIIYNVRKDAYPQAALFAVYLILAAWGWISWKRHRMHHGDTENTEKKDGLVSKEYTAPPLYARMWIACPLSMSPFDLKEIPDLGDPMLAPHSEGYRCVCRHARALEKGIYLMTFEYRKETEG